MPAAARAGTILAMPATFLVASDGSDGAERAARFAAERARAEGAKLVLLHVVDWSPYEVLTPRDLETRHPQREREVQEAQEKILLPLAKAVGDGLEVERLVRHGHPAEKVCEVAEELSVTQVFSGRRGRTKLRSMLFGSVSGALVQSSPVPLTVVP